MKSIGIIVVVGFFVTFGNAQVAPIDSILSKRIHELKSDSIDNYFYVYKGFIGPIRNYYYDKKYEGIICEQYPAESAYVLWSSEGIYFLQRIDACGFFEEIQIEPTLMLYYNRNKGLLKERVRLKVHRSHYFYTNFFFPENHSVVKMHLPSNLLENKKFKRRKQIIFVKLLNEKLNELTDEKKFTRSLD
jgi:hypothetical protein